MPSLPHQLAKRAIRVTDLGEFVRHKSCQRRFRLGYNNQEAFKTLPHTGRPYATMDPVLAEHGKVSEAAWARDLEALGFIELDIEADQEEQGKGAPWEVFVDLANKVPPGQPCFAREVQIIGVVGAFKLFGRIDFVLVHWESGQPRLHLVECKASRKDRTYQRMQVVVYRMVVEQILAQMPLQLHGKVVDPNNIQINVVRIDESTHTMIALDELAPIESAANLKDDIRALLAEEGLLDSILDEPVDELPFQLGSKCDDCQFNIHCLSESTRQRRLELLGLAPDMVRALNDAEVLTIDDLADMDEESPAAEALRQDQDFIIDIDTLLIRARARQATLPRAQASTSDPEQSNTYAVRSLPHSGRGQLPPHEVWDPVDARGMTFKQLRASNLPKHKLVRVYLNVHFDYVEDRIGALSAHVTTSSNTLHTPMRQLDDGTWEPDPEVCERYRVIEGEGEEATHTWHSVPLSGRTLTAIKRSEWTGDYVRDTMSEQTMLQEFFGELVEVIQDTAPARLAPVHFYLWSEQELTRLIEACNRTGGGMLRYLRELLGCRESLEQLIYSDLSKELTTRFATGWTGRGLTVQTSLDWFGKRFHWRRKFGRHVYDLDVEFTRDLFDFGSTLYLDDRGEWSSKDDPNAHATRCEVRTRFFDNLSAPYFRAYWDALTDPDAPGASVSPLIARALRDYRRARQPGVLKTYLEARVQAMRWLEERVTYKNNGIHKPLVDVDTLPDFRLQASKPSHAAIDFLRLDQHVKLTQWLQDHMTPPYVRVANGRSLPIKDLQVIDKGGAKLRAYLDLVPCYLDTETMRARSSIIEGKMVRLHPRDADPRQPQTPSQLRWHGSTAVIKRLDWEHGVIELDIIRSPREDRRNAFYVLKSKVYRDHAPPPFATLDASITDFVGNRVESRLLPVDDTGRIQGEHVQEWFHPSAPSIPPMPALSKSQHDTIERVLREVSFGPEQGLLERRIAIILAGLTSRIQLVQGPPGTGKTMVAALAILVRILARRSVGDIVLVSAHTHTAVDTLLERIVRVKPTFDRALVARGIDPIEVTPIKIHSSNIEDVSAPGIVDIKATNSISKVKQLAKQSVLVMGGTTSGLLKLVGEYSSTTQYRDLDDGFQTPFLVIDEASMMVCAHFLALASCLSADGELLMAGDHRQLAPIMAHDWDGEDRPPAQLYRMHESAFDAIVRIGQGGASVTSRLGHTRTTLGLSEACIRRDGLETTYRLPAQIRRLIQPLYDRDGLTLRGPDDEAADLVHVLRGSGLERVWRSSHSLYLLAHTEDESRQSNRYEAHLIKHLLAAGKASGAIEPGSVAVITPHRAQRALLTVLLEPWSEYVQLVDTVERLQGGEAETIFFSACVSDPVAISQETEFILDIERANVAFSRTKRRLIVLAAKTLLDFVPPMLEHYQTAMLWKHLRSMCDTPIADGELMMCPYTIEVPST